MMTIDFFSLAVAAVNAGNISEGVRLFEQARAIKPKDAEILAYLGQSLLWLGKRKEGLGCFRQAGSILAAKAKKTKNTDDLVALGEQLQYCNDYETSIKLIQQAIRINRSDCRAFQLLAQGFSRLNQNDQALNAGRLAVKLNPDSDRLTILLSTLEARAGMPVDAMRRFEQLLLRQELSRDDAFIVHKELASLLDKQGMFEQAFNHLQTAAGLKGQSLDMPVSHLPSVDKSLEIYRAEFDNHLLDYWSRQTFDRESSAPIFLIGFLRSGTTLVQEILDAHPDVFVADENDFIAQIRRELACLAGNQDPVPRQLKSIGLQEVNHLRRYYWRKVTEYYGAVPDKKCFIDKTTLNTIDLGLINCIFPDAKFIFVLRDPRDVCLSCFMQNMTENPITVHMSSWQGTMDVYACVMNWWLYISRLTTLAGYQLRYEDAVQDFEATFKRLFVFLGLTWDSKVSEFHRNASKKFIASPSYHQVSQPLYDASVGRWRNYSKVFENDQDVLSPIIEALGY